MLLVFCFLKCLCINFPKLLCKHVEENDVLFIFGGPYYNVYYMAAAQMFVE